MNKKSYLKILGYIIIGAIFGGCFSLGLIYLSESGALSISDLIGEYFTRYYLFIEFGLIVFLYLPSVFFYKEGKRILNSMKNLDDEKVEEAEKKGGNKLDVSLTINSIMNILNLILFGMTFTSGRSDFVLVTAIFMIITVLGSVHEISVIKFVQSHDSRLKGDPTSLRFGKDFLKSCDEAEKLKIYKSGYRSFQFSKNITMAVLILTMLGNIILDTGAIPVMLVGILLLVQVGSYSYYSMNDKKSI